MEAIAKTKNLKGSPRKARLVIDLIRGRNVSQALAILKFTDKRAAEPIAKTLQSAIANATYLAEKQNIAIDPDDLFIKTCFVDMGVHKNRRRMRPAPQGRAYRETRHYCHITILVSSDKPPIEEKVFSKKEKTSNENKTKDSTKSASKTNAKNPVEKSGEVKETKKAKAEETKVEEVETPITEQVVEMKPSEVSNVVAEDVKSEAEIADAKDATSQTTAEKNETKPADEAQLDKNEKLERQ